LPLPALPFLRPNHGSVGVPCRMTRQRQGDDEADKEQSHPGHS
jgi:hypothetical protein